MSTTKIRVQNNGLLAFNARPRWSFVQTRKEIHFYTDAFQEDKHVIIVLRGFNILTGRRET